MIERRRQPADDLESAGLPEPHGALVRGHEEVELYRAEAARLRALQRVLAHGASDTAAFGRRGGPVATIGDVRAAAFLVGAQIVGADNRARVFSDEYLVAGREPVAERLLAG